MAVLGTELASAGRAARAPGDDLLPLDGYRPDVQALRGLAVLIVVLYHSQVLLHGGFVGVDVFFVISGFVIGRGLLRSTTSESGVSLRSFYERRARRLLPALAVMLVAVTLTAPLLAPIGAVAGTGATGTAAALLSANAQLFGATGEGYFAASAELNPLLHTWSLSVEEQFYLVIPALLLLTWRRGSRSGRPVRALRIAIVAILAGSLVLCVLCGLGTWGSDSLRGSFYSPVTRTWEFAVGLALVVLPARSVLGTRARRTAAVCVGVTLVLLAAWSYDSTTAFPGLATILPVAGAALVIHGGTTRVHGTARPHDTARPGLPVRPLIHLGDLSYGWYLWHWPFVVWTAAYWPTSGRGPLLLAAALALVPAWLSRRILEQHHVEQRHAEQHHHPEPALRAVAVRRPTRATLVLAGWCIVLPILAASSIAPVTRFLDRRPAIGVVAAPQLHRTEAGGCNDATPLGDRDPATCTWGDPTAPASVVFLGDSNADHLSEALIGAAEHRGVHLQAAVRAGCPVMDAVVEAPWVSDDGRACRTFVARTVAHLVQHPPDAVVIANGTDIYLHDTVTLVDPLTGHRTTDPVEQVLLARAALERTITSLRDAGIAVAVVNVLPKPSAAGIHFSTASCSRASLLLHPERCRTPPFRADHDATRRAQQLEQDAATAAGAAVWTFDDALCPARRCGPTISGDGIWSGPDHITAAAATSLVPATTALLQDLLGPDVGL